MGDCFDKCVLPFDTLVAHKRSVEERSMPYSPSNIGHTWWSGLHDDIDILQRSD